ncbi:MAG: MATE family efflux transporter [Planctomycetota bacterium]
MPDANPYRTPDSLASAAPPTDWWSRPAGGREVLAVAVPLVVSSLSWTVMTFVDRMMLFRDSTDSMTAAFQAGTLWFTVLCFPLGVCTYASTFVSQYHGAGQPRQIGPVTWQAVWLALAFTPLGLLGIPLAEPLFAFLDHPPGVQAREVEYFRVLCWGIPGMLISVALSGFYSGRGRTGVVMVVDALFALLNVVLDYLWIFGAAVPWLGLSIPAGGVEGAAWATVVSLSIKAVAYAWLVLRPTHRREFASLSGMTFSPTLFRRMLRFGGSNGLQMVLEVTGFFVFIALVGRLGAVESAATSIAFNISSLAFMPVWGLSLATSILVGQHLGEDRDDLAGRATWTTYGLGLLYMCVISLLYLFAPQLFLVGFFGGGESSAAGSADAARSAEVYALAVVLLRFVAAYNLLDASLMIFAGAIKGAGDMRFVLAVSLVMAVLLGGASWLAVERLELGVFGCWTVVSLWIAISAVLFFLRFLQGKWRAMRVIETPPPANPAAGPAPA